MMKKLIFSLILTSGILLILEGLALKYNSTTEFLLPDPDELWKQPQGSRIEHGVRVRINSLGLRGAELLPKNTLRIATVGDSSVFGFLVEEEDIFSTQIVTKLKESSLSIEHINGAAPGHSTYQSLNRLRWLLPETNPDLLIIGNLWSDSALAGFQDSELYHSNSFVFLTKSALFRYLVSVFSPQKHTNIRWHARPNNTTDISPRVSLKEYQTNLFKMHKLAKKYNCKVVFLALYLEEELAGAPEDLANKYRTVMQSVASSTGSSLWDAQEAWNGKTDLFADFLHPNANGHKKLGLYFAPHTQQLLDDIKSNH